MDSFLALKKAMMSTSVLCYPNFTKTFVVEIDTCGVGTPLLVGFQICDQDGP